jgi:hypothetical protein
VQEVRERVRGPGLSSRKGGLNEGKLLRVDKAKVAYVVGEEMFLRLRLLSLGNPQPSGVHFASVHLRV